MSLTTPRFKVCQSTQSLLSSASPHPSTLSPGRAICEPEFQFNFYAFRRHEHVRSHLYALNEYIMTQYPAYVHVQLLDDRSRNTSRGCEMVIQSSRANQPSSMPELEGVDSSRKLVSLVPLA